MPNSDDEEEEKKNENKINIEEEENENKIIIEKKEDEKEDEKEKKEEKESSKKAKKEVKEPPKKDTKKEVKKDPKKVEKKPLTNIPKKFQNVVEIEGDIPPEIYGIVTPQFFKCKQLENTPLSSTKNPYITISSPEKKEGSFFVKAFISYLVTTSEININVRRRYSDFVWLHQALLDLYPYLLIPPIPKKNKIGVDNFNDVFISKRMRYLEKFMNWTINNPVLKNSQLLYDFLSMENEDEFNKKKVDYQKMDTPQNLIEFYAKDGKMNLTINKEKEGYFKKIYENNPNTENLLNNLNANIKHLKYFFDMFILKLGEVQKNWDALFTNSTKNFEDINLSNTYEKMSKLFTNWGESLQKQNDLVFIELREYFKYVRNNFREMRSHIMYVDFLKSEYERYARYLVGKKNDLFQSKDVKKWEMDPKEKTNPKALLDNKFTAFFKMCVKDTDKVVQRRTYYGFYLNQFIEEYERIRKLNGELYKKNLNNFGKKLTDIMTEFLKHVDENTNVDVNENKNEENI